MFCSITPETRCGSSPLGFVSVAQAQDVVVLLRRGDEGLIRRGGVTARLAARYGKEAGQEQADSAGRSFHWVSKRRHLELTGLPREFRCGLGHGHQVFPMETSGSTTCVGAMTMHPWAALPKARANPPA